MTDKVFVGTIPSGERFFAVEREGRRMPLLDGTGAVSFWPRSRYVGVEEPEFVHVLNAMDNPEGLKLINPAPKGGRGADGLWPHQREMIMGLDLAQPGSDFTAFWRSPR